MTWKYLSHICDSFCLSVCLSPCLTATAFDSDSDRDTSCLEGNVCFSFGLLVSLSVCAPCLNVDTQESKWFSRNFPAQTINIGALHNWAGNWIEGQQTPTPTGTGSATGTLLSQLNLRQTWLRCRTRHIMSQRTERIPCAVIICSYHQQYQQQRHLTGKRACSASTINKNYLI